MLRTAETLALRRAAIVLLLVVLLPALFYSLYQINTLSEGEELIAEIYRQQLDVVLFSLNQYSWDAANGWVGALNAILADPAAERPARLEALLARQPALRAVLLADSTLRPLAAAGRGSRTPGGWTSSAESLGVFLASRSAAMRRLFELQASGYRKLEPVVVDRPAGEGRLLALLSVTVDPRGGRGAAAMVLDEEAFVRETLAPRLNEAAADRFVVAVLRAGDPGPVFSTAPASAGEFQQRKALWLFPDYAVGIRMQGTTVEEILRRRLVQNLVLLLLLDLLLIGGAWAIYRSLRRELELVRMRADFVSTVSHELRTPLALIRMYAETLEMGRVRAGSKRREYYTTILRETERLTRLVNNVLNFSRIEAGRKEYVLAERELNPVVEAAVAAFRPHLEAHGFTLRVDLPEGLPRVRADAEALTEALINLLDNAVKYSGEEKEVGVRTGRAGAMVFIEVEDRGVGIPVHDRSRVFEPFYRVSSGLAQTVKGTGLGLALVKHVVAGHGGLVTVTGGEGAGSIFRLELPALPR